MKKLEIAGYLAGLIIIIISSVRYWAWYPDIDKAIAYTLLGALFLGIGWIYGILKKTEEDILSKFSELSKEIEKTKIILNQVEEFIADNVEEEEKNESKDN